MCYCKGPAARYAHSRKASRPCGARAEEAPARGVPDGEREIAEQMLDAAFAPGAPGAQDQLDVRCAEAGGRLLAALAQGGDELAPRVNAGVGDDPRFIRGFARGCPSGAPASRVKG